MGDFSGDDCTILKNMLSMDGILLGWLDVLAMDKRLFEEISLKTNSFGYAFEGCAIFQSGRFQLKDFNNKSVNLFSLRSQLTSALTDQLEGRMVSSFHYRVGWDSDSDRQWIIVARSG